MAEPDGAQNGEKSRRRPPRLKRPPYELPVGQMREYMTSYIYGNITILGATIALSPEQVRDGLAVWAVLATGLLTFFAHVLAHIVGQGFGRDLDAWQSETGRSEIVSVIVGARSIATSSILPALLYLAAWLGWIASDVAQTLALAILAVRIGLIGLIMQRYSGRRLTLLGLLGGGVLAAIAFGIGMLKVVLTH